MNLKEAKEYLQNNGFAVQRLNECGSSDCGGDDDDYVRYPRPTRSTSLSDVINRARQQAAASRRTSDDETLRNLLTQIPPEKKALLIQLLQALIK